MTADFIKKALATQHPRDEWLFATEIRTEAGYGSFSYAGAQGLRIIDAFAMHLWPSKNHRRVAYEIKVTKSDFIHELEQPLKRTQAQFLSDQFYFVLAENIFPVGVRSVPAKAAWREFNGYVATQECGILIVKEDGEVKRITSAPVRPAWPMPAGFIASFAKRVRDQGWQEPTNQKGVQL